MANGNEIIVTGEGNQVESDVAQKVIEVQVVQTGPQGPPGEVSGAAVTSFNARTGAVVPANDDYEEVQIKVDDPSAYEALTAGAVTGTNLKTLLLSLLTNFNTIITSILSSISTLNSHASNTNNPHSVTKSQVGLGNADNTSDANKPISTATQTALDAKLDDSQKGAANGLAELDSGGLVPTAQLPSYVDDVIEAANFAGLPGTGATGKIYVTLDDNKTFRWSGSAYVEISASLALGETSSTAYRGDRGKTAYDHSQVTSGNPHGTTDADIPVTASGNGGIDYAIAIIQALASSGGAGSVVGNMDTVEEFLYGIIFIYNYLGNQTATAGKGYVNHGSVASTARPGYGSVEWVGSVEPTNAINGDTWVDTST